MNSVLEAGAAWQQYSARYRPLTSPLGVPTALQQPDRRQRLPSEADCEERFFTQTLDHFRHLPGEDDTFQQRYFLCREFWGAPADIAPEAEGGPTAARGAEHAPAGTRGPIFFYAGNEADVSLYLHATGLMWENAPAFEALLVFAEHRFYGKSLPFGAPDAGREYLSTSQALADYAYLISALKQDLGAEGSPVIAFGGSYGGMLAAWLRLKFPHIVHGAVAASAPVLALEGLRRPSPDPESFAETVTRAAGPAGGASPACADNARRAFHAVISAGAGAAADGRRTYVDDSPGDDERHIPGGTHRRRPPGTAAQDVARLLRICPGQEPQGDDALLQMAWWARSAFDYLAMGNFPYPSGYILNSGVEGVELPAWPLRSACSFLAGPEVEAGDEEALLSALADAIGLYYNATADLECFSISAGANNASAIDADNWNWQACTEMVMPMSTDGQRDMFWAAPWDRDSFAAQCQSQFGVSPRAGWAAAEYGDYDSWSQITNIAFSNGLLDPWSGMGVVNQQQAGSGVTVIVMEQAAHHLDLFFEHPLDPDEVRAARREEMSLVEEWVRKAYQAQAARGRSVAVPSAA